MKPGKKGLIAYLLITFGVAWSLWIPVLLVGWLTTDQFGGQLGQRLAVIGTFAPALAAFVARKWVSREGFADAGLRLFLLKKWPYYLFALLLPIVAIVIIIALSSSLNISQPDFSLYRYLKTMPRGTNPFSLSDVLTWLPVSALIAIPFVWGSESGWRGYFQLRIFKGRPLHAALITGLTTVAWQFGPTLIVLGIAASGLFPGFTHASPAQYPFTVLIALGNALLLAIILGWLRLKTGSIWPVCLASAASQVLGANITRFLFYGGPNWLFVSYIGLLCWIPLGLVCLWIIASGQLRRFSLRLVQVL
ncbi:MAG: CPBP family glutamic-type intramembrane protease [Chloroflexota bacterium]|nr:CPBP family glutamic-type intramembrane protease [Chloroflexota bacterium]